MKRKHILYVAMIIMTISFVVQACKKQDYSNLDIGMYKSIVDKWKQKFLSVATEKVKERTLTILPNLKYAEAATIQANKKTTLYIIPFENIDINGAKYLVIRNKNGTYTLDGVYAASSIGTIGNLYKTGKLPANETVTAWGLDLSPKYGWFLNKKGDVLRKDGRLGPQNLPNGMNIKSTNQNHSSSLQTTLQPNYVQDPDACIAWYWVYYDPDFGLVWDFIRTTGNCDEGSPSSDPPPNLCDQAQDDYNTFLDATDGLDVDDYTVSIGTSETTDPYKKNKNPVWKAVTNPVVSSFYILSTEAGVVKWVQDPSNPSNWRWEWDTFVHSSTSIIGGNLIGGTVTLNYCIPTPSFAGVGSNILYAGMSLNISVKCMPMGIPNCPEINQYIIPYNLTYNDCNSQFYNAVP